jgi:hypothetical protein
MEADKEWVDFKAVKAAVTMKMALDRYQITGLKQTGDELRGACPIHKGASNSRQFSVNLTKNAFQCFYTDCKARGNVLDFVALMEGCSVRDAALKLAGWFTVGENESMPIEQTNNAPEHIRRGIYQHFKGNKYLVTDVAVHSETGEELIIYRPLYGDYRLMVRPKAMFFEEVERNGYSGPRFKLLTEM